MYGYILRFGPLALPNPAHAPPMASFLILTNHNDWRHHHTHTHTHTHSKSSFTSIHSSLWRSANNMLLLLDLTNIAQLNIPISTAAPTHHVSICKTFFFFSKFSKKKFSKLFWGPFPGPRGSRPPFSNSPSPATYPQIFPDVSTSFLSPSYSGTPDVSTYFHPSFFTILYSFFNFNTMSMSWWTWLYTTDDDNDNNTSCSIHRRK